MENTQVLESGRIEGNFTHRIFFPVLLILIALFGFTQGDPWGPLVTIFVALVIAAWFFPIERHNLYMGFKHGYYLDAAEEFLPYLAEWNKPPSYKYEVERDRFTYNFIDRLPKIRISMAVLLNKKFSLLVGKKENDELGGHFEYHLNFWKNSWNVTKTHIPSDVKTPSIAK